MTDQGGEDWGRRRSRIVAVLPVSGLVVTILALIAIVVYDVPVLAALTGGLAVLASLALATPGVSPPAKREMISEVPRNSWPEVPIRRLLDALPEPAILTDGEGLVRFQNTAAVRVFGRTRPGDPLTLRLRSPEILHAMEDAGRGKRTANISLIERLPTERAFNATATPIQLTPGQPSAGVDFILMSFREETDRLSTEKMRADFIANASHELRTPLASLTGFVETLLGPARDDAANRERFLKIMLEQAQRMARLIDDLLSLSRIEMKAHVQPSDLVDLDEVVAQVGDLLVPLADENNIAMRLPTERRPALVRGDRDELTQVIANLIENGIKYGRDGGHVSVEISRDTGPDGKAGHLLTVRDDGLGIAEEHLPRLTERFYRADPDGSRRRKGTGLGLAIVKHIITRHKGRLTIRSKLGEGSAFSVFLPGVDD